MSGRAPSINANEPAPDDSPPLLARPPAGDSPWDCAMNRDNPLLWFAGILAIGAVAGWALGNDLRVSAGLYAALVASFGVGLWCGREERDAS